MSDPERPADPDGETRERSRTSPDRPTDTQAGKSFAVGHPIAGRYEILELLGSGGFGAVYRAHDRTLDRMVALKIARPRGGDTSAAGRFQREARATARLEHPHAVRIYDAGEAAEGLFLVLELVNGESAQDRLRRGALPPAMVAVIGRQAASALAAAHALGIVHRDIKPANLLLTGDGTVKVADFGIARLLGEERLTSEGSLVGTPDYMSPDQIEGGEVGPAADLFALGVVLYEMLTGRRPFGEGTTSEVLMRIVRAEVPPLPAHLQEREPELCRTIVKLLQKRPTDRPTAAQVAVALGSADERPAASKLSPVRRRWPVGVAALVAVIATIVVVAQQRRHSAVGTGSPAGSSGASIPSPPGPTETRTVTLSRLGAAPPAGGLAAAAGHTALLDLQDVLRVAAAAEGLTLRRGADRQVVVTAPADRIDHAATALAVLDALDAKAFAEPNLFTGREPSRQAVSFSLRGFDMARFLYTMGAATGWPVVVDDAAGGPTTMQLSDVPWDAATQTLLEMNDLRSIRFGDVWIVTTRKRAAEIEALDTPFVYSVVPKRTTAAKLAALLEGARSEHGAVAVDTRLGRVAFGDRSGLISRYASIIETVEGTPLAKPFTGHPVDLHFYQAPVQDIFRLFTDISGLNVAVQPGIRDSLVSVRLAGVPWDNALDTILRLHGLKWTLKGNLLTISKPRQSEEPVAETLRLAYEDPRFFLPFAKCLTPAGTLRVDETSRTLVVRDVPERARWFVEMARDFDERARR